MDTVEIRKLAKTSIKGKHFKACVIFLIYVLFCMVISMVPFVGSIATLVLSFPLSYSLISTMMKLKNDENVGYFDFISTAFSDFGNAWKVAFSMLGKLWPYLLGYFLGTIILVFCVTFYLIFSIGSSIIYNNSDFAVVTLLPFFAIVAIISIACIVFYVLLLLKSLYYSLSYYILHDNSSLTGKEIVEKSRDLMQGNRWNLVKMQIPYYLIYFGFTILILVANAFLNALYTTSIFTILSYIAIYAVIIYIMPLIQFSQIEFYEKLKDKPIVIN